MAGDFHEAASAEAADAAGEHDEAEHPGRLRSPLLDDGQPSFHWWMLLPGVAVAVLWAAYQAVTADDGAAGEFLGQLAWPGTAIYVVTTIAAYLGWRIDLD